MKNHVLTVVTHPAKSDLSEADIAHVKSLLSNAGAQHLYCEWLSEGIAFDCYFQGISNDIADQVLSPLRNSFDIAIQVEGGRRKKLLIADMDSTMITMESLDNLADIFGLGNEVRAITERSMRGEMDFEASLRTRVKLLKGKPASALEQVLAQIEYNAGAKTLVQTMKAYGAYTALVSGGFTFTTKVVAETLGFHEHHSNSLLVENNQITGELGEPISGPHTKCENLARLCKQLMINIEEAATIGDGANDIPMLRAAGLGVSFYGKPIVCENTKFHIKHGDLTALLFYQGYHRKELVGN